MLCLDCYKELEPSSSDKTVICSEYTIVRFVECSCGSTNDLSYDLTGVVNSYVSQVYMDKYGHSSINHPG